MHISPGGQGGILHGSSDKLFLLLVLFRFMTIIRKKFEIFLLELIDEPYYVYNQL